MSIRAAKGLAEKWQSTTFNWSWSCVPIRTQYPQICLTAILCASLVTQLLPRNANAWKPGTHGATANIALYDAVDGHICLPGISDEQIFIGGDLVGYYGDDGDWKVYNDLVSLAAYFRAGANGPDAWPDAITGQIQSHVDWSRKVPAFVADDFWNDNDNKELQSALSWIADDDALEKIPRPITNAAVPQWRSSDWGDEVLKQALAYHQEELAGHSRSEALADSRLSKLYKERQASIAFALGYLMHLSGDSFAHTFVNEFTKSPFDMWTGRQHSDGDPYYTDEMIHAMEELKHIALEKYAHERFIPGVVGDGCEAVDLEWTTETSSICDDADPGEFELSCEYCNPLRGVAGPPDAALSDSCDRCFEGCNPWKEVCPPKAPEGLPCTECPSREDDLADCNGDSECIENVELGCHEATLKCCDTYAEELVNLGIIEAEEAEYYVCPERGAATSWDIINDVLNESPGGPFAPNDCYQGTLDQDFELPEPVEVKIDGEIIEVSTDGFGFTVDLNGDGEPDLINECMLWNCLLSPGSEFCSLRALVDELPSRDLGGSLVCDSVSSEVLNANPNVLLLDTDIAIPRNFYRKVWLERRYPEGEEVGSLGTYSIGGLVPNGVYVITDTLKYFEGILRNFRNPAGYFIAKCGAGWDSGECEMAKNIGKFVGAITAGLVIATVLATAINAIPFVGPFLASSLLTAIGVVTATLLLLQDSMIPGLTLPIAAMRDNLERHLEENWIDHVITTSQRMAGGTCANTCGQDADEAESCPENRLLGLSGYLTWAEEAFDIVDSLDCNENNYFKNIIDGEMSTEDWIDLIRSGGHLLATQYLSCQIADYFYETHFRDRVIAEIANQVRERSTDAICGFVNFYGPTVDDDFEKDRCEQTLKVLFGESGASDDRELLVRLKDLIGILDNGLNDEQRQELYGQLNNLLARTAGIQVDFDQLRQLQITLDCSLGLDVDFGDIITNFDAREVLLTTMDTLADDGDPNTLSPGEEAVDSIDRAFGYYDEQMDALDGVNGPEGHAFAPIDVNRFAPMYNTIALNKLILLGSGNDRCKTLERECQGDNPPSDCGSCDDNNDDIGFAGREFPSAGIFDLIQKANDVEFSEAYDDAYSTATLDENPDTYLESFFQEQFVEEGSWQDCAKTGFNIVCGAFYSIDDPTDYCSSINSWDPDYLKAKLKDKGVTDLAASTVLSLELAEENGITLIDGKPFLMDCAFALSDIDTDFYQEDRSEYAPDPRYRIGADEDPRNTAYNVRIASDDHLSVDNHRSTVLDRVIKQIPAAGTVSIFEYIFQYAAWYARWHGIWEAHYSNFVTWEKFKTWVPFVYKTTAYYPHDLTRFPVTNKDSHVSRLYSRIFAPYHCAEVEGSTQEDSDCDSVPDSCDNCPLTYNPDQLDSNRDSIGDDCIGFDPFSFPIAPTPVDKINIQCD